MSSSIETYAAPPSALRYMLQACWPSSGWHANRAFPDLCLTWRGFRIETDTMRNLQRISGNTGLSAGSPLSLLVPHVAGFRLLMAMLFHRSWPLPVWGALQVRNRLLLHRPLQSGDTFDLITRVAGWRVLDKGLEVDLHTRLQQGDQCAWESVVTFYYRGRFGPPEEYGVRRGAAPISPVVNGCSTNTAQWRIDGARRRLFCAATGDYNGIHQWDWYARRFGFPAAFAHSQRIAIQCLAHLPPLGDAPQQLDLWIKGPVFYGHEVLQRHTMRATGDGYDFALCIAGDERPALVGSWHTGVGQPGNDGKTDCPIHTQVPANNHHITSI